MTFPQRLCLALLILGSVQATGEALAADSAREFLEKVRSARTALPAFSMRINVIESKVFENMPGEPAEKRIRILYSQNGDNRKYQEETYDSQGHLTYKRDFLWDGERIWDYRPQFRPSIERPGTLLLASKRSYAEDFFRYSPWGQYFNTVFPIDGHPFYENMLGAESIEIREEALDGQACYYLEADTKFGRYQVWVDATRGYNLLKGRLYKSEEDIAGDFPLNYEPAGMDPSRYLPHLSFNDISVDQVRVETIGDHHLVARERTQVVRSYKHGGKRITTRTIERDNFQIGTGAESEIAYELDIRNGTRVVRHDLAVAVPSVWQDGEIVPKVDVSRIMDLDETLDQITLELKTDQEGADTPGPVVASQSTPAPAHDEGFKNPGMATARTNAANPGAVKRPGKGALMALSSLFLAVVLFIYIKAVR